jgi:hypothetical protein
VRVDIVGTGAQTQVIAQTLQDKAGSALDVRTVPTRDAAVGELRQREISGAFVPSSTSPQLLLATAGSDTTATVVQDVFDQVALAEHAPLTVTDVVEPGPHDPTSQALFFLLVALSIGSYASVAVIGGAGGALPLWTRALLGLGVSLLVSVFGTVFAGPVFHFADGHLGQIWALSWVYSLGIVWVGTGLHTFLKRWTTLAMTMLFVALNFTSSGGIFQPALQNGFFSALHAFWNGAGFLEAARNGLYFPQLGVAGYVLRLVLWMAAGAALLGVGYAAERSRRAGTVTAARVAAAGAEGAPVVVAEPVIEWVSEPIGVASSGGAASGIAISGAAASGRIADGRIPVRPLPPQVAQATGWSYAYVHQNAAVEEELEENAPV